MCLFFSCAGGGWEVEVYVWVNQAMVGGTLSDVSLLYRGGNVRFGSKADICNAKRYVRFTPKADMCGEQDAALCQ